MTNKTDEHISYAIDHVVCGGAVMNVSFDVTASLRANMKHHEPIVLCLEHHPADSRIKVKDDDVCQSLTSRMGTGGATCHL